MSPYGYGRYVPVAERRAKAARKLAKLSKAGRDIKPIRVAGRAIANTFWGKAWCENLEAYSDYANRLPRGRTYTRNGSILDLQIAEGRIDALVSGSELYTVTLRITPLPAARWQTIRGECAGQIDSLVELLQGKLSSGVMEVVTRKGSGLFPGPKEIELNCSCPDWAVMCKHVAASLYGVGARLDHAPEMLFSLRGVDPTEMIEEAIDRGVTQRKQARGRVLEADDLASVFGVDIEFEAAPAKSKPKRPRHKPKAAPKKPAGRRGMVPARSSSDGLTDGARRLLAMITAEPGLRTPRLAEGLGISLSAAGTGIARLKSRGLVVFVGAPRTGGYRLVDEP